MKKLPKISIVIPSYNKAEFIQETLDSVVSQNYPNLEVIIQDGGSTDGTVDIIREFARKYPKEISWVSKKDKGQVDAINKGLKKATGDVVTYINADDVYKKGALGKAGGYFSKHPDTLWLAGRGKVINEKGKEIVKFTTWYKNFLLTINRFSLLLVVNYFMQPSVFLSRKTYEKYGPFTGIRDFVMEYDLWLKIGKEKMPDILNDNLSLFRINKGTTSYSSGRKLLDRDYLIAKKYTNNIIILMLHKLNNIFRILVLNFIRIL